MGNPKLLQLAALRRALTTDRVLSAAQVLRYSGLATHQLPAEFVTFRTVVQPIYASVRSRQVVMFVTRDTRLERRLGPEQIAHLAGTAEIRHSLRADAAQWSTDAAAMGRSNKPDGVYALNGHQVAIEFDAGSYRSSVIRAKVAQFSESYAGLVWGVTSRVRYERLHQRLTPLGVQVLHVNWWSPEGADRQAVRGDHRFGVHQRP